MKPASLLILGAAAVGLGMLAWRSTAGAVTAKGTQEFAGTLAEKIAEYSAGAVTTAAGAAGSAATGAVYGLGSAAGLPDTRLPETVAAGQAALARGDYLEASLKLPAGDFLTGLWRKLTN